DFAWTAPAAEGTYPLTGVVDPDLSYLERNRLDNTATLEVAVAARPPAGADFKVVDLKLITVPGESPRLQATILNQGTAPGTAPVRFDLGDRSLTTSLG